MVNPRTRVVLALALPPVSWFVFEQGLSALLHADCGRWGMGLAWGSATLMLCGISIWLAWPLQRPTGILAIAWLARLALTLAGIFALAVIFQTLAVLLVPACLR